MSDDVVGPEAAVDPQVLENAAEFMETYLQLDPGMQRLIFKLMERYARIPAEEFRRYVAERTKVIH